MLFLSERERAKDVLLKLPRARRVAERFVAGEGIDEALAAVRDLNERGLRATLDYLGESVTDREEARRATRSYRESLSRIDAHPARSTISLKLTQLGLDIDEGFCAGNLREIVALASELGNFVRIDMEGSEHTEATLRVFRTVFPEHRNVGVVIQSYLRRSAEDVEELVRIGAPVRLCKGAYDEPPEVAFQHREEVDASYVRLMRRLLDGIPADAAPVNGMPRVAIATHDDAMLEATRRYAAERGLGSEAFEFQMLYGVRRDEQTRLVGEGYELRVYVPYGGQWYPYFMRRMAERPANLLFVLRALARG